MADKDVAKIVRRIEGEPGWEVRRSGKNYYLVYDPDGRYILRIPSTPKGTSFYQRTIKTLKKAGFPW